MERLADDDCSLVTDEVDAKDWVDVAADLLRLQDADERDKLLVGAGNPVFVVSERRDCEEGSPARVAIDAGSMSASASRSESLGTSSMGSSIVCLDFVARVFEDTKEM